MRLSTLLKETVALPAEADCDVARLTLDSRNVQPNDLFCALSGTHLDGREFVHAAIAKGALAVLISALPDSPPVAWYQSVPIIAVPNLRQQVGFLAARFYDYPSTKLTVFGVTGTNGKTSCSHFLAQILTALQTPCAIMGTLGSGFYGALGEAGLTTPDAITLQKNLKDFLAKGAKAVAMEVSSHSIDQGRVNGIEFDIGLFTNLTQDHLDYHGTLENYASVKKRFLAELPTRHVIINADDVYGAKWIQELANRKPVFAYSTKKPDQLFASIPFIYTDKLNLTLQGIEAEVHTPWGSGQLTLPLIGHFNLSNCLAVLTALCVHGIPFKTALSQLSQIHPVAGRMQTLTAKNKPLVVVDYAHTPDALLKVLEALRSHVKEKLVCVFGCGGERDHGKRPLMAQIAEQLADQVIVTNDNPRHEKPEEIAQQILQGFAQPKRVSVMLDRSKAIENSIQWATANDCILIAGKGAEQYQQIGDEKIPFDDVTEVRKYLSE